MLYLNKGAVTEIVEKKSKFIGSSFKVNTVEEANLKLEEIRKKYWDATHNCYAYIIDDNTKKCSDDGEPQKTAGYPILDVIEGIKVYKTLIVVTRYFGGTLLGTGGLIRAYSKSAKLTLENSEIIDVVDGYYTELAMSYEQYGKVNYLFQENNIYISDTKYLEDVSIYAYLQEDEIDFLNKELSELSSGVLKIKVLKSVKYSKFKDGVLEI